LWERVLRMRKVTPFFSLWSSRAWEHFKSSVWCVFECVRAWSEKCLFLHCPPFFFFFFFCLSITFPLWFSFSFSCF
jgi:hypothetical protein